MLFSNYTCMFVKSTPKGYYERVRKRKEEQNGWNRYI